MEAILAVIAVVFGLMIVGRIIRMIIGTTVAAAKTAAGKGSFEDNLNLQLHGMGEFEIKTIRKPADGDMPFEVIEIEGRGLIPVDRRQAISFVTSVLDATDPDNLRPVISSIEDFQEPHTIAYQHRVEATVIEPGQGFADWVRVGVVLPDALMPPQKGRRRLMVIVRIVPSDATLGVDHGFQDTGDNTIIVTCSAQVSHEFTESGYEEIADERAKSKPLSVRLAVAVAMADGSMDESEAGIISAWTKRQLSMLGDSVRERVKEECNTALKEAYRDAKADRLSLSEVTAALNEIDEESPKYQAVELCLDVMAADGVAEASELQVIRQIAEALGLDYDELQRMKDLRMVGLDAKVSKNAAPEEIVGIDETWSRERIREHLRSEFAKWNARLNNLTDPDERANAQSMLDLIADLRKKYA